MTPYAPHAPLAEPAIDYAAAQLNRVRHYSDRVAELLHAPGPRRNQGRARPVVCLSALDAHGKPLRFPSLAAAAVHAGVSRSHHVQKAIELGRLCGGHRYRYATSQRPTRCN